MLRCIGKSRDSRWFFACSMVPAWVSGANGIVGREFHRGVIDLGGETVKDVQLLSFEAEVFEPGPYV